MLWLEDNNTHRTRHKEYFPPTTEIKDYNVRSDKNNFFD